MRFMVLRLADPDTEAGVMPSEALLAEMGQYMESLANAGVLLGGEGCTRARPARALSSAAASRA